MPSRNRIAMLIPAAFLVALAIAGAEAETAYLRKAVGVEIGFSCADWLEIYSDMSESVDIDEWMERIHETIPVVEHAPGYQRFVFDYESAASVGAPARVLALAERLTDFNNGMMDIAMKETLYSATIFSAERMSEYPRVHAYLIMQGYDEMMAGCR